MSISKRRRLGVGLAAGAGAGLMALTSVMYPEFAHGADIGLVMGGSGLPIPGPEYVQDVNNLFIAPNFATTFPGVLANGLFTPEGLYPLTGVNSLPLNTSLEQGVTILNDNILANEAADDSSTVFGYSQSATLSSLEMKALDPSGQPSDLPVRFVLIGDPSAPNGGLLERFAGLDLSALGITFSGATPSNSFQTVVYTLEYDGFADFPQYPINLLADINAFAGIYYVHGTYPELTPAEIATAIKLSTEGPTETTYYLIPVPDLPILDPLRAIPIIGTPLADLLQPDLTVLINLGYGADNVGYSIPANVPTTFGLFPDVNLLKLLGELVTGAEQGVGGFLTAASSEKLPSLASLSSLLKASATPNALPSLTDIINMISSAISTAYGTLLPTADIINGLLTSVPAYLAGVSLDSLTSGQLVDAVGLPIAGETGLLTLAAGIELLVLLDATTTIIGDFKGLPAGDPPTSSTAAAALATTATGTTKPAVTGGAKPAVTGGTAGAGTTSVNTLPKLITSTIAADTGKTLSTGTNKAASPTGSSVPKILAGLTKDATSLLKHAK